MLKTQPLKLYKRIGNADMRKIVPGEDLSNVTVSWVDNPESPDNWISRDENDPSNMWLVDGEFVTGNFQKPSDAVDIGDGWLRFERTGFCYAYPYIEGMSLDYISVADGFKPETGDMIAVNTVKPEDSWMMDWRKFNGNYVEASFEELVKALKNK